MLITTPKCFSCGKTSEIEVDRLAFNKWQNGMFVQDAFPTMPADKREQLLTGTHPGCWIKIFSHPFDGPNLEGFCDECGETIEHPYHAEDDMAAEWIEANNPSPDFDI